MPEERICPRCGTALSSDALDGLCPACVGRAAFAGAGTLPGGDGEPALSPEIEAELARLKPEEAGEWIGPYKLMEQIGQGGFGTVWVADQERPVRRRVALKIIKLGMDTKEVIARFELERQALAMMDHPHIAKVLDAGATQWGRPFFVMDLVRGIKITDYCDQANLPTVERLALFIQVCTAVQHAHQKGIIHRDLKPSNILVTLHDGVPVPKVIDFGVAKATQQQRLTDLTIYTQFQQMIGTPLYMSPEQAEMSGLDIDTRSDIYSLGVLLYELLTGRTPFDPEELMRKGFDEMRRVIREQEPNKPSTALQTMAAEIRTRVAQHRQEDGAKIVRLLRGDLDWIVMKALEKDRTRRYETANGFALDIQRHLANQPVMAAAPSMRYLFRKFARRNKTTLGIATLIAVVLLGATGVSVWQARLAITARKVATAKAKAEQEARKDAEAISTFLTEVFQSPDPTRDGRTITVAETLDRAAKKLETDLTDQPDRRAKLQTTLANTYESLGIWGEAKRLREKVRDYYVATFGLEHPDTLTAMFKLAGSRQNGNVPLMEEVLTLRRKVLGAEHPDTLYTMTYLAELYRAIGRLDEGLKLAEQATALARKVLGPEHRNTFSAMYTLGFCYSEAGRLDESIKLLDECLTYFRKTSGPKHPTTLLTMWNLGAFHLEAGRQAEGMELLEASVKGRREVQGAEHSDARWAMERLAKIYDTTGRKDEALELREEVSARNPKDTVSAMRLAVSQRWYGRDADYAATIRRMLDWAQNATKPNDLERVAKLACLRPIDDSPTREAALALARKAVDLGKENQTGMPWYQMTLGMAEYRSGHDAAAVEALTIAEAVAPSLLDERYGGLIRGIAGFYHAMSLSRQGKQAEARALFNATEAAMTSLPAAADGADHDDLILWLACKEAKALLHPEAPKAPTQPDGK